MKFYGTLDTHNIDGAGAKLKLTDYFLMVRDTSATGSIIGCTSAKLA